MNQFSITLEKAGLTFTGDCDPHEGLKGWLARKFGQGIQKPQTYAVEALKNISLEINHGERVGLIGLNGSGKSTLLRVMAGIYPLSTGTASVTGHVCPLFEFATGFENHQSGWDNIRIRGLLLGMSPEEVEQKLPEIGEFSELGEFLNYPVSTYSSGMFIRLAFSVSTSINPEILLLDEVIGAGDFRFAEKASTRMKQFMDQGKILVLTTHSLDLLEDFCERTIWLHKGAVMADGPTANVLKQYKESSS